MLQGPRLLVLAVHWLAPTSAWSVLNAVLCSLLFQTFFQEDAAVVTHTNPISLPRHPGLPLLSMLNGMSPPVRLGNLYHGGQIC